MPAPADEFPLPQPVLIVDDDEMMTSLLRDFVETLGATDVQVALEGEAAWALVKDNQFDLIILDWKLPGVTGLTLFNRIRQLPNYAIAPICISSGLLTREDCFLLDEYPATRLLAKPYTEDLFTEHVRLLVQEWRWHTANLARLDDIVAGFKSKDAGGVAALQELLAQSPNPTPIAINAAKVMRQHGHNREAEALLRRVLTRDPPSIMALSELGKVLFSQGRTDEAQKVLLKAQGLSPKNLHRLCLLGEIELASGSGEAAGRYFKQALAIDAQDEKAQAGLLSAENVSSLPADQRQAPEMLKSMAGLMNITAISTDWKSAKATLCRQ